MFVIFPADELILMTYGPAIPRLAPRPTLDCLRDPEVPIEIPPRSLPPPRPSAIATTAETNKTTVNNSAASAAATDSSGTATSKGVNSSKDNSANTTAAAHNSSASRNLNSGASAAAPVFTTAFSYDSAQPAQYALAQHASNSLPPTPTRHNSHTSRTSRTSLTHSASAVPAPDAATSKRSSVRSNRSNRSLHQQTPPRQQPLQLSAPPPTSLHQQQQLLLLQQKQQQEYQQQQLLLHQQQQQQEQLLRHLQIQKQNSISKRLSNSATAVQMQNDAADSSRSMQGRQGGQRPTLERSSAVRGTTPQRGLTPQRGATPQFSHDSDQLDEYAGATSLGAGGGQLISARDRSPSIFLEPPSPDPTQIIYGPGWGRPMSPMDLPPEPRPKSPTPSKSSRLRPKLHLPLGRLGRSTSTDQRESNRLKEDLQLLVDNPVFNCENLRQRNFDAFFESGEPKYKLQPMTPNSAPAGSLSSASSQYSPQIDGRSTKSAGGGGGGGGLFAPTPNEGKAALNSRSRSTDQPVSPGRERRAASVSSGVVPQKDSSTKSSSGRKSRRFFGWRGPRSGSLGPRAGMASYNGVLKDYGHSSLNEAFKSQNNVNFKLIKTVSDFTETLSHLYEEHATALQSLVSNFRKKNAELRKERPACHLAIFQAWETFLQEVESDSQASNDVANVLSRQVSRPMLDKSFHRKVQSRKIFTHRESFETIIAKTEEKLSKCRLDYKQCYMSHRQSPTPLSLTEYIDAHNAYVQQLHATNAMLETYHCETVPQLMQELEEIHNDLCSIIAESIQQGADVIANKASDQAKRYGSLTVQCSAVSPMQDLTSFVRILPPLPSQVQKVPKRIFAPPQLPPAEVEDNGDFNEMAPVLRNELVFDRHSTLSLRPALESLKREAHELEMQIRLLQDTVDGLNRTQQRGIEGQLYNKVNELQEELSLKKFDLRAKQLHFAAIRAQKDLYVSKVDPGSPRAERKLSAATAPSMKTKWLKAFRSLKPASGSAPADRRNGAAGSSSQPLRPNEDGSHHLQEYTYKKITACDVCSQILRGHTRQGLRCRICKLNAHGDCASQLPRCQPKQKLLRRQKSTSELENRVDVEEERPAEDGIRAPTPPPPLAVQSKAQQQQQQQQQSLGDTEEDALLASPNANQTVGNRKFRQKVPFIDRIAQLEFTDIDQIYRVLKQTGELKSANIAASTTGTGVVAASADKSVQGSSKTDGPDIQIVNVPDYPERTGIIGGPGSSSSTGGLSAIAATAVAAAQRAGRGVRPPPVPVPILGVQLQQQELAQQRSGGLPVPQQDVSSSSAYRLSLGNAAAAVMQMPPPPSMASLPTSSYISGGIGINYYTASQPSSAALKNNVLAYQQQQQQQQLLHQQQLLLQQQAQALPPTAAAAGVSVAAAAPTAAGAAPLLSTQQQQTVAADSGMRRRLFAGFRPLSGFGRLRSRSSQHRSISLPETPHSPRRQKLNLRMKSLSLDSPESTELHGQIRRRQQPVIGTTTVVGGGSVYYHGGSGGHLEHNTPPSNNSRLHSPSSPSHQGRKLLYATRGMRGGSVDLPDEMEKSQSSASTSPCPSPVRQFQKSHRLLPTNLYVILYNFKARHADELDLKAGYKVTVIDTSDPDWWQGKLLGRVGYFPSKYCVRLNANEKPLQVTHNLQVSDGERGESMTLLRDQIVIQTGDEVNGMVMVRSADNRQGYCPVKYLQEV